MARNFSGGVNGPEAADGIIEISTQGMSDVKSNDLFGPLAWELGMIRAGEPRGTVVLSLIGKFGFPLFIGFR